MVVELEAKIVVFGVVDLAKVAICFLKQPENQIFVIYIFHGFEVNMVLFQEDVNVFDV